MACNIGYVADEETIQEHLQVQQVLTSVADTPNVQGGSLAHSVIPKGDAQNHLYYSTIQNPSLSLLQVWLLVLR